MTDRGEALDYFEANLMLLSPERGGRSVPIRTGYRPTWWLPGDLERVYASGSVEIVGADELRPRGRCRVRIYPFAPEVWRRVEVGSHLEMCEGPVLMGEATVTRVVPSPSPLTRG